MSSLTPVQAQDTSVTEENVTENDVEAYAKRKLLKLNIGGDFAARGELSSKMLTIYPSANAIAPPVTARTASNEAVSSAAINPSSLSEAPATRLEAAVHASKTVPTDADAFESDLDDGSEKSDNEFVLPDADSSEQDFGEHIAPSAGGTCLADGRDGSSAISVNPLKMGWARRPKRGEMYGTKYVALYEKEIEAMFQQGEKDQSQNMGPARMLEALILANPHRSSNSSGDTERSDPQQHLGQKKKKMVPTYANFLAGLVKDDPRIMPRHALAMLYYQFPDARGKADEKRVRDKVSDLQRKPKIRRSRVSSPTSTPSS
ncbi:hypothetical protein PHYSODRAFT_306165 [Phytophthora sojae]|uniref:Uncharacterized protein n=1 Tax=Phytophthora sojae (strain P6497) TaxID=1094619 RepID=G5A863_PHYSP|nr:hypothetical protein PHYSODRAFT_306165 [Phytophthora sojae]EGZ08089.1 hypothetical protein PHYSODRAFT_306165 [Phytophthora sojae]|eukprot:XP_009536261.1 hypothetical protein PHYSODRAFT_306165 [Phytophthora sojae]